ncbi:aspartyl-tRNA synthetase (aspS) [Methanocaldococcus jannaschii DSM 2661]|uniref:Aspartate--tRNA(Asp/Asn) ligase n=2 Tax=Methanocaldococcus jannaschii TaxID=2190 RepID=SYDND_METJA|nr:RecName: Full=Aspartate--tRNA(Asp/Asn) ligase; AltName: Full=Aspartyl-tRNA synthetase; Short=AspRS; AltName: Full=Non-discriminating aspartyl-tRNA synthetase; Short=ND-AspRS [Methanocaldococcus jannaschii DSM 2661]AAB99575.1 aspartyl-tRNA synthetase (aspS) [Methanocaldococcus jannaschii DSM 2661]
MVNKMKWRRTHYSADIKPEMDGQEVIIMGWVHSIRALGKIIFVILRDREGTVQIVAPKQKVGDELFSQIKKLGAEDVIAVKGKVIANEKAPNGFEILPLELEVINTAKRPLPLDPAEKVPAELDTRLENRFLDLRRPKVQAIFKIRSEMLKSVRNTLYNEGFIEVNTPKLVASCTEGGTELFPISYFEREAFLGQSPQLYKQMLMATGLDRVFEIAPIFRAEEHNTRRHLNEATSIDIEMAFADDKDAMDILEKVVYNAFVDVYENRKKEIETLGIEFELPPEKFDRITYDEAIDIANAKGVEISWGEDLSREAEKAIGEEMEGLYFITDWPSEIRPFYTMPDEKNPNICKAFDLMYKDLEISSGAQRIHLYDLLVENIKKKGLNPDGFTYYLEAFKYGMPPHAGWGLGADRFTMVLTQQENIRECVLFPRDRQRLTP